MRQAISLVLALLCGFLGSCRKDLLTYPATPVQLTAGTDHRLYDILVLSDSVVLVAGGERFSAATILRSVDGGSTWTLQSFPDIGKGIYGLALAPNGTVMTAGFEEKALRSVDGGRTWVLVLYPRSEAFTGIAFEPGGRGWLVGGVSFHTGCRIEVDASGGSAKADSLGYQLNKVAVDRDGTVYTGGYGIIQYRRASDAGWSIGNATGDNFSGIFPAAWGDVYACGMVGSILRTQDGGRTWAKLRSPGGFNQPSYALHDMLFTDPQHGYCVGEDGLVIFTDDAGEHWSEFERFTTAHLRSIAQLPSGDLLVCGDAGALWRLKPR